MQFWVTFGAQMEIFQMPLKDIFVLFPYIVTNVADFNNLFGVLFDDRIEHQILFYLKLAVEIPNAIFIFSFQAEMNFCKNFVNTCCGFCHLKESH